MELKNISWQTLLILIKALLADPKHLRRLSILIQAALRRMLFRVLLLLIQKKLLVERNVR